MVGKAPNFLSDWVFFFFNGENYTQISFFNSGYLKKKIWQTQIFWNSTWGNTTVFFFLAQLVLLGEMDLNYTTLKY